MIVALKEEKAKTSEAELNEFFDSIDFDKFYDLLNKKLGLNLKYTIMKVPQVDYTYDGDRILYTKIVSNDFVEDLPESMSYLFKKIVVTMEFTSEKDIAGARIMYKYDHPTGGSNGHSILNAIYKNGSWDFTPGY